MSAQANPKHPEATVGMLIVAPSDQVLLIKSHKSTSGWTVPGGHVEYLERVEDAVRREALEETGLSVNPVRLLTVQDLISPNPYHLGRHFVCLYYMCETSDPRVHLDMDELQEFKWVSPREALEMPLTKFARFLVEKYAEFLTDNAAIERVRNPSSWSSCM